MRRLCIAATLALCAVAAGAGEIRSSVDAAAVPQGKATPLGLYLAPADAHAALTADPSILFIEVRDPVEVSFVGHPDGIDANVPLEVVSHRFDPKSGGYVAEMNPDFLAQVDAVAAREGVGRDATVFVTCRSGARSAAAARLLIAAGYTDVWNLVDGFEGDKDRASGARSVNGWRNAGLPWSYKIAAEAAWSAP
ncbi:MAG: hypothetical protein GW902_03080 [Alphaproteobacteria bacterium]|nr:hypothetical protein [Alphaproteobacteria bacterium]